MSRVIVPAFRRDSIASVLRDDLNINVAVSISEANQADTDPLSPIPDHRGNCAAMAKRIAFTVHGKVQGVCFRDFTQQKASSYGITGYVKNTSDGKVCQRLQTHD